MLHCPVIIFSAVCVPYLALGDMLGMTELERSNLFCFRAKLGFIVWSGEVDRYSEVKQKTAAIIGKSNK